MHFYARFITKRSQYHIKNEIKPEIINLFGNLL